MASWKEIERIRKDVRSAKSIAANLLKFYSEFDLTGWEKDFLESMTRRDEEYELTTRQVEKLLQIRDGLEEISECRGFSVKLLIKQIYEARLDLDEGDEQWITSLHGRALQAIKRKDAARLMRCAKELFIIEEDVAA